MRAITFAAAIAAVAAAGTRGSSESRGSDSSIWTPLSAEVEATLATTLVNDDGAIAATNAAAVGWTAGRNARFNGMTLADVRKLLGAKRASRAAHSRGVKAWDLKAKPVSALPTAFDVRSAWPGCASVTGHIRDQSDCGSCWAVSSTETFNDRLCITYNYTGSISAFDTMSCCDWTNGCLGSSGCDGGIPEEAWSYYVAHGAVTGGDYGANLTATCANYPFAECAHHEPAPPLPLCPTTEYNTPACPTACPNAGYPGSWASDKHMAKTQYNVNSVNAAMTDMVSRGSLVAAFEVYSDFLTYTGGVYKKTKGATALGGHAVKILGWNVTTAGEAYWIVANSWNANWGLNGTFWIAKGVDECGFEDDLSAGTV